MSPAPTPMHTIMHAGFSLMFMLSPMPSTRRQPAAKRVGICTLQQSSGSSEHRNGDPNQEWTIFGSRVPRSIVTNDYHFSCALMRTSHLLDLAA